MGKQEQAQGKGKVGKLILKWIYNLRSVGLAIPVAAIAVILALSSMATLPDVMLIGTFELSKGIAVIGPLALTAACLLMTFCSKQVIYPWLISIFSLVLPVFLQIAAPFLG